MNRLDLTLDDGEGRLVSMSKTIPDNECLDRDDLVQTFCNFLEMAGYIFPDEDDEDELSMVQAEFPHYGIYDKTQAK